MGGTSCTDSTGVDQYYCITLNYSASVYCGRYWGQYSETITFGDTVTFARFHETRAGCILCVCGYSGPETLPLIDAMCLSVSREVSCDSVAKSDCLIIGPQDVGRGKVEQVCTYTTALHLTAQTVCTLDNDSHTYRVIFLGPLFARVQMPCKAISAEYYFCVTRSACLDCVQAVAHCTESSAPSIFVCRCLSFSSPCYIHLPPVLLQWWQ